MPALRQGEPAVAKAWRGVGSSIALAVIGGFLWHAFTANSEAENDVVAGIRKDVTNDVVVELRTVNQFGEVILQMLGGEMQKAAALRKGNKVVVACPSMKNTLTSPYSGDRKIN